MKRPAVRAAVRAGQFYERSAAALRETARECAAGFVPPAGLGELVGGVVPHAGWMFSGPTAAKVFVTLESAQPEVYVLLGAVHSPRESRAAVYPSGAWATPLGEAPVDEALASAIEREGDGLICSSAQAHDMEHSIEVQLPFIQLFSPKARIVPLAVPPSDDACRVGDAVARAVRGDGRRIMLVASTDLTHYGMGYGVPDHGPLSRAKGWMRENDARIIRLAESLRAEEIVPEAEEHANACGSGALAAAVSSARSLGASAGRVLEYTTSDDVIQERDADRAVGYVGIVFHKSPASAAARE